MNNHRRVAIERIPTGVPGLDAVLGGGLPDYSFNLIAGSPGGGKTTLAHQIMFANASADRPALYFTVLGEPPLKMLRYQQQFSFFDFNKVDGAITFINLCQEALEQDLSRVLDRIVADVERVNPGIVVVDSFRTVVRAAPRASSEMELQSFVQRLALHLTGWQATTFLVGEYVESELQDNPVFTVADGILWLSQAVDRNSIVRKLRVMKMRGASPMPGLHTFRITNDGIQVFPRLFEYTQSAPSVSEHDRLHTGVQGLDELLSGGIPSGDAVLLAGPSGSGKTVLSTQVIAQGVRDGEPGVIVVFEEHPGDYLARAKSLGFDMDEMVQQGSLVIIYLRPLDLSVDEALHEIQDAVERVHARRVVIDSLSGFELALAPTFRDDFRESLYRLVGALTGSNVTVLMTVEISESFTELHFSPHAISFLCDDLIMMRYVEMESQFRRILTVVKMRSGNHSKDLREYEITSHGLVVGSPLTDYRGLITGMPELRQPRQPLYPGLTDQEILVLQQLLELGEAPIDTLARRTGLPARDLTRVLDRLVRLTYAIRVTEAEQAVYRPVARPLG